MCQEAPTRQVIWQVAAIVGCLLGAYPAGAQTATRLPQGLLPDWRRIGDSSYQAYLPSAATGPVDRVWFAPDGSRLFIRTVSGRFFETGDFENWAARATLAAPAENGEPAASMAAAPEPGASIRAGDGFYARLYAYGENLYRSDDGGRTWANRTALRGRSILGSRIVDLAVAPRDPDSIVAVNSFGVWRSLDGGLSWYGLNDFLPNLPVRRLVATPNGIRGTRITLRDGSIVEWSPGEKLAWRPLEDESASLEEAERSRVGVEVGEEITALVRAGDYVYGGSADGTIWVSLDGGASWRWSRSGEGGHVEALFVSESRPALAVASLADPGGPDRLPRVVRTSDGGFSWEDLTGDLPAGAVWGVTADATGSAIYLATDQGIFLGFDGQAPAAMRWLPMSANLPPAPARDVRLDDGGYQLFIALDGYGVYAAPAPHRFWNVEVANSADFSRRPAAPGSLLTILGGRLLRAQAGLIDAPILHATETQSQIQIPFESQGPAATLSLELPQGRFSLDLPLLEVSPAIFVDSEGGALLLEGDSGVLLDALTPARPGGRVQVLATGLGRVRPEWRTGIAAPLYEPPSVIAPVRAYLDGAPLDVTRATLAPGYIGFYLVEVRLPALVNAGPAELYLEADGHESNRVRIHLEP